MLFLHFLIALASVDSRASAALRMSQAHSRHLGSRSLGDYDDVQIPRVPRSARMAVAAYTECLKAPLEAWRTGGRLTDDPDQIVDQCSSRKQQLVILFIERLRHVSGFSSSRLRRETANAYFHFAETPVRVEVANFSAVEPKTSQH